MSIVSNAAESSNSISFDSETKAVFDAENVERFDLQFGNVCLSDLITDLSIESDSYYEVSVNVSVSASSSRKIKWYNTFIYLGNAYLFNSYSARDVSSFETDNTRDYILTGDILLSELPLAMRFYVTSSSTASATINVSPTVSVLSCRKLTATESADYESGYNAGYSDGYSDGLLGGGSVDTDGSYDDGYSDGFADGEASVDSDGIYNDGYSDGFADGEASVDTDGIYDDGYSDGFADGEASVDTDSIYSDAYQAGYEAGLLDGSDDTLKEEKRLVKSIEDTFTIPGQVINQYYQQYISGPTTNFVSGGASITMPVPDLYCFEAGKDYLVDFKYLTVTNSNVRYEVTLGEYVSHSIKPYGNFYLSGPGLSMSDMGEAIYSPSQTGGFDLRVIVPADLTIRSTYGGGIENDYVDIPSYGHGYGILNWDSEVKYRIDVYEVDIVEEIDYLRDQSNKLNDLNNTQQESLDVSKETAETTKNMFTSMKEFFGSFFDNFINSFIRLFVPESSYFTDYFDRLNTFFEEKFGFLYQPIGFFVDIVNAFLGDWGNYSLTFPGFFWEGQEVWPDIDFSFDDTVSAFPKVFEYIRLATNISILVALINLIYRKYEEVMRN